MSYKPKVPCKHPYCGVLVPSGQKYSAEHKSLHPEESGSLRLNRNQKVHQLMGLIA